MSITFLHAADIHLDSPLRGLAAYDGAPVDQIRSASRKALSALVDLAVEREVDFVLLAGDIYDGEWKDANTGLFFQRQMARLRQHDVPVFLISGNHDAESVVTRYLPLPANVTVFPTDAAATHMLEVRGQQVALHGQGFARRDVRDDLAAAYPPPVDGALNIGMLHTCASDSSGLIHAAYAPCSVPALAAHGYDYWALGHVHEAAVLHERPWVVFPGVIQGRHIREQGPKGCYLVTADSQGVEELEFCELDVLRWQTWQLDVSGAGSADDALAAAGRQIEERVGHLAADHLWAVRIELVGACAAHAELASDPRSWRHRLEAYANDFGGGQLWLERVKVQTTSAIQVGDTLEGDGPVGELVQRLRELPTDQAALADLLTGFSKLRDKLPRELRTADSGLDLDDPATLAALVLDVESLLVPRLATAHVTGGGS